MTDEVLAVPAPRSVRFRVRDTESEMTTAKAPVAPVPAKKIPANSNRKLDFKANDHVVYPTHGVGRIMRIEEQEVAGIKLELFVITFDKDKMTLRVPTLKAKSVGMRKLSSPDTVATALNTLKGRARIKRTMWSRRAQEYEAKINSGDLVSIAEVVRDLHRASGQPEQSYSERQLYEAALARMAREVAAVEKIDETAAVKRVEGALLKKAA
jgi:CarD family transcriptional regulator